MTMVSTGPISIGGSATSGGLNQSINIELGRAATATSSLNESALRTLAGVPSGAISLSNFYGKSNAFAFTISTSASNIDLRAAAVTAGWNQNSLLIATIAGGVTISSSSTGSPALTISGLFPSGVQLVNDGVVVGRGGNGGNGGVVSFPSAGSGGSGGGAGTGLSVSSPIQITNNGTIAGGGGGGGGGGTRTYAGRGGVGRAGGGGGGGIGVSTGGASGGSGSGATPRPAAQAGTPGTLTTAGGGGAGSSGPGSPGSFGGTGGSGGGYGSAGSPGTPATALQAVAIGPPGGGGAAGPATQGNSNITWLVTGNRFGPLN